MEYLNNIEDPLKKINEKKIQYINLMERPDFIFGLPLICGEKVDFFKYPSVLRDEIACLGSLAQNEFENQSRAACGCRIRLKTSSTKLIFKVHLKRKWDYRRMNLWNSSGFDVYDFDDEGYTHRTVFGPQTGDNIFAESIPVSADKAICIFLPNYNVIEEIYLGIDSGADISAVPYANNLPIIFYGNSITQGAAASRSGNSMCNIVSRKLDRDIINLSISSCCRGNLSMADMIGKINCKAIIVDYTRNADNAKIFEDTHLSFYERIREYHPNIPIILMTSSDFHRWKAYYRFDEIVKNTYKIAVERADNTYLLDQKNLFCEEDYDLVAVDGVHYNDYGMFLLADKLCGILTF